MKTLKPKWDVDLGLGKTPMSRKGAPLSFSANLTGLNPGDMNKLLSTSALANGFRNPYLIDEIRMQAYMSSPAAQTVGSGYAVSFQFRTGAYAFSLQDVPMGLYAPVYNSFGSSIFSSFTGGLTRIGDDVRWQLPRPLWMAPGDQIQALVSADASAGSSGNQARTVDVTYVGRSLPPGTPGPKSRSVPWVSSYIHDFANAYSETSTEFRNPFSDKPWQLQKLICKTMNKSATGGGVVGRFNMLPDAAGTKYASVYMEDSLGYKITRDYHPAGAIFDTERCVWTFQRPIGPREQVNMKFRTVGTAGGANVVFGVSAIGCREEAA